MPVDGGEDLDDEGHEATVGKEVLQRLGVALLLLGCRKGEVAVLLELDVRILPLRNVAVGEEILRVEDLVEFLEHLARVAEGFEPGPLHKLLFVALPAGAVNEVVIPGAGIGTFVQI